MPLRTRASVDDVRAGVERHVPLIVIPPQKRPGASLVERSGSMRLLVWEHSAGLVGICRFRPCGPDGSDWALPNGNLSVPRASSVAVVFCGYPRASGLAPEDWVAVVVEL
jgi:hypothetical protein